MPILASFVHLIIIVSNTAHFAQLTAHFAQLTAHFAQLTARFAQLTAHFCVFANHFTNYWVVGLNIHIRVSEPALQSIDYSF